MWSKIEQIGSKSWKFVTSGVDCKIDGKFYFGHIFIKKKEYINFLTVCNWLKCEEKKTVEKAVANWMKKWSR